MRKRDMFLFGWIIYGIPMLFSTMRGSPFDFLFTKWGWSAELYLIGLLIGTVISFIIMGHDERKSRISSLKVQSDE